MKTNKVIRVGKSKQFAFLVILTLFVVPSLSLGQVYFSDDFENGLGKWIVSGYDWDTTSTEYRSPNYCITDSPDGDYKPNTDVVIRMANPIDLSSSTAPVLSFWFKYFIKGGNDWASVEISTDGGGSWNVIYDWFYNDHWASWDFKQFDLKDYKTKPVLIQFRLISDGNIECDGIYIDDVEIKEKEDPGTLPFPFFDDFENGLDNWIYGPEWSLITSDFRSSNHAVTEMESGDYKSNSTSTLMLAHPIDLSRSNSPILRFWFKFYIPDANDKARVRLSKDGGTTWETLKDFRGGYSSWTFHQIDLSNYKWSSVQLMFQMWANGDSYVGDGWYLDDVEIIEKDAERVPFPFFDDFENGLDNWMYGPEWTLTTNKFRSPNHAITESEMGNFLPNSSSTLLLAHPIDLSASKLPKMQFYHKIYIPDRYYDYAYVRVSKDGGNTWHTVKEFNNITIDTWKLEDIPLYDYKSSEVLIMFQIWVDGDLNVDDGWYIDDVEIVDPGEIQPVIDTLVADPVSGQPPLTVTFKCFAHDPNGTISKYMWDFDGDGTFDKIITDTDQYTYTYENNGTYKAICIVIDNGGYWSQPKSVSISVYQDITRIVEIPDTSAAPGNTVNIPIKISDAKSVAGAEIKVTCDSTILNPVSASTTTLTDSFTIAHSDSLPGKIAITMACSTGLPGGTGEFVNIKFQVSGSANIGDTSPLHFELVALYEENTNPIPVTTQDGNFTVISDTIEVVRIFIQPPTDTLNIADTREFSAYGKRSDSSEVAISVNWMLENKFGNIGSISPGSGEKTTFTATGPGDGLIKATYNDTLSATAVLVVGKLKGDVNIDEKVNVQDAIRCLQIIVYNYTPSLYQLWAADFDSSCGWPDEGDALGILKESLKGLLPKVMVYKTSGPAIVSMGSFIYKADDIITVPILIDGRDDIFASGFEIHYNSQVLMALAAISSVPSSYLATNFNEPGTAKISLINTNGLVNSQGEIIKLKFRVNGKQDGNPELKIKEVRLFDRKAQRIEVDVNLDQETITAVPKAYNLHQNYPNPFNPTTTIRYSLPEASEIKLIVYNMNGQEIKTLATGKVAAGSHSIVWDGRDNAGHAVPSGVYFYKLSVESQQWQSMKKMILLK